jgi:membrane glycosyltransferase
VDTQRRIEYRPTVRPGWAGFFHLDAQTIAGLEASCLSLLEEANGPVDAYIEAFVLSDTQDPEIAAREQALVAGLQQRLAGKLKVHYRRREENIGRKAGNLTDFCERWEGVIRISWCWMPIA